jgi:hypothetical protein
MLVAAPLVFVVLVLVFVLTLVRFCAPLTH